MELKLEEEEIFWIELLPQEIQFHILNFLNAPELSSISCTSSYWNQISFLFWKRLCEIKWNKEEIYPSEDSNLSNWKAIFRKQIGLEPSEMVFEYSRLEQELLTIQDGTVIVYKGKIGGNQAVKGNHPFVKPTEEGKRITLESYYV
eukprot:TRINITY_DN5427_c0_g1_i2.p2 TRINITY_DN5427_c0_g1~~TRINITY_DN5427_c0_g1_i2.p2  ORF type:complete len:146 (+),score=49.41 TRINITY_DN5427_c0_g1_i2:69-506(+)